MSKVFFFPLVILAVTAVAIADIFLKKAAVSGNFLAALKSPWMLGAIVLYLFQIVFFTYIFAAGWKLSVVGTLQTVFYALIVLVAGIFLFHESLTTTQLVGAALGIVGVILLTL